MKVSFVRAVEEHKSFLAKVCRDADYHYSKIMPSAFEKQAKKFEKEGLPNSYNIYIIQENVKNIGFLGFKDLNKEIIYLVGLYLILGYQRKGYGEAILKTFMKELKDLAYKEIVLLTHKESSWAINFYKKNNFEIILGNLKIIREYANGLMEEFAIPTTFLLKKNLFIPD